MSLVSLYLVSVFPSLPVWSLFAFCPCLFMLLFMILDHATIQLSNELQEVFNSVELNGSESRVLRLCVLLAASDNTE